MSDIFLSYSREDQTVARRYAESLQREGFDVWWDQTLNAGEAYDEVTEKALEEAKAVIVLWSKSSVASRWVRAEATTADRKGTLVPVMIEACKRPIMFELRQSAELSDWRGDSGDPRWQALVDGLRRLIGKEVPAGSSPPHGRASKRAASAWRLPLALGALLIAVVFFGWKFLAPSRPSDLAADRPQVLVVPFDVSADAPDIWKPFADDVPREVINNLKKISGLRVVEWPSASTFKGNKALKHIRDRLPDADYVLDGGVSFSPDGTTLRVTTQLTDLRTDGVVSGRDFQERTADTGFFEMQVGIAKAVSVSLKVAILRDEQRALGEFPTQNPKAYRPYVAGYQKMEQFTYESLHGAIDDFNEAIALDAEYFAAYLARSDAYRLLFAYIESPIKLLDTVKKSLDDALRIRPDSAEVYASLGLTQVMAWEWDEAWKNLSKAKTYDDSLALTELGFALYYMGIDEVEKVKTSLERADRLDPFNAEIADWGTWALFISGEEAAAKAWSEEKMLQHPTNGILFCGSGVAAYVRGDFKRAVEIAEKGVELSQRAPVALIMLAQAYGYDGQREKVLPLLKEADAANIYLCPYETAVAYLTLDERGKAIEYLYKAVEARSNCLMLLRSDPRMQVLREDPTYSGDYGKLLALVGLDDAKLKTYKR